ncbi:MAG TPA: ATP-binding protein [Tepidiformaceae bacterium]|nr:ATP-binding protein [Tepidiformaceae bacterium]
MPPRFSYALFSLKARITLFSLVVVGIALALAGFALITIQEQALTDNVEATVRLRANDIAAALHGGSLPSSVTVSDDEIALVQVLDASGAIIAASPNIAGHPPVASTATEGEVRLDRNVSLPIEDDGFMVLSRSVETAEGSRTIIVAGSREDIVESVAILRGALQLGIPLALLLTGLGSWFFAGRALAPVERIRREVAAIGEHDLARRVPQPPHDDEIGRLAGTMNAMLGRLQAARERQEQFVADAAHELRSPLTALRTQVEVARLGGTGSEASIEDSLAEIARMQRLADDLLAMADADRPQPASGPVDLDDLVFSEARRAPRPASVALDLSGVSAGAVRGDREQLARAIRNVLENAIRHAASRVTVSLAEGATVRLTIEDDGPGVPPGERERIFDRFQRLDSARTRHDGGAGLGLAISRAVIERHGGRITVDAAQGGGARFVIILPASAP